MWVMTRVFHTGKPNPDNNSGKVRKGVFQKYAPGI
jgi:hypothetical protein